MSIRLTEHQCRILYVIHLGCVDARLLAIRNDYEQILDLMDVLEVLPDYVINWQHDLHDVLRDMLVRYKEKYPEARDYIKYIYEYKLPPQFDNSQ